LPGTKCYLCGRMNTRLHPACPLRSGGKRGTCADDGTNPALILPD
jgi:hypothetical protein